MKFMKILAAGMGTFLIATQSYAIFNADAMVGKRTTKFQASSGGTTTSLSGNEIRVGAYLDPIPLVPVAFGLSYDMVNYPDDATTMSFTSFAGSEINLEVKAWFPIGDIKPFIKVGYTVVGAYILESDVAQGPVTVKQKSTYKAKGTPIGLGINYSLAPLIGLLLEYDINNHKLEVDKLTVGGIDTAVTSSSDLKAPGSSIMLGVQVGI